MEKAISVALDSLSAFMLSLVMILSYRRCGKQNRKLLRCVFATAGLVVAMLAADAVYNLNISVPETGNIRTAFISKELYFAFNASVIVLWVEYIMRLIWDKPAIRRVIRPLYASVYIINILLVLFNIFTDLLFRIDTQGRFSVSYGGMLAFTVLNYASVILILISVYRNRSRLNSEAFYLLLLFQIPVIIGEILAFPFRGISMVFTYSVAAILLLNVCEKYSDYREIDRMIDDALESGKFEVYYQPIYSVHDDAFTTCEALLRLRGDDGSYMNTALLIEAAEESGKIGRIGEAVLEAVCAFVSSEEYESLGIQCMNINLSMLQMEKPGFADEMLETIRRYRVSPSKICIELTETVFNKNEGVAYDNLSILSMAGILLALDDYGSGYSNLHRIALMPFTVIKLDRSLIQSKDDRKLDTIVESTMAMLKKLDLVVVAEGVETKQQLDRFIGLGVDYVQGYYFAKPRPAEDYLGFMRSQTESGADG